MLQIVQQSGCCNEFLPAQRALLSGVIIHVVVTLLTTVMLPQTETKCQQQKARRCQIRTVNETG